CGLPGSPVSCGRRQMPLLRPSFGRPRRSGRAFRGAPLAPVAALPGGDVLVVLVEGGGEDVGAVVLADEVEVGDVGRGGGGGEGAGAGGADGAGRQAGVLV